MYVSMKRLNAAFQRVRRELHDVGLLEDGKYLDQIDVVRVACPTLETLGFVFDDAVPALYRWVGFEEGVVYVPIAGPFSNTHGHRLIDVIRHEFAHAWAWLDPARVDGAWFRRTFGASYRVDWKTQPAYEPDSFATPYASTSPAEDFCETVMLFLQHRRHLGRFRRRSGLYAKLRAVEQLVKKTARSLRLR